MESDPQQLVMEIERKATRETRKYLASLLEADDRLRKDPKCLLNINEIERSCAWVSHAVPLLNIRT
ncbi:MAG: hypothetical protein L6Q71_05580 [Planctomycetes bacterium]|nr:hypothetical protein [Planctomycetota bacterium]NUQ35015.1 hypothetical protein [Planctomycetaceae bacterium]